MSYERSTNVTFEQEFFELVQKHAHIGTLPRGWDFVIMQTIAKLRKGVIKSELQKSAPNLSRSRVQGEVQYEVI